MREWLIRKLGGFVDAPEAIKAIKDKEARHKVLTMAVKKLFNTIGSDDILQVVAGGDWLFLGKPLSDAKKHILQVEAQTFLTSELWKVLVADVSYQANKKMFLEATDDIHLIAGKLWLYNIDAFKTRMKSLSEGKGTFNQK